MRKLLFTIACSLYFINLGWSQTETRVAQTAVVKQPEQASPKRPSAVEQSTSVGESSINEDDPYQGRRQEFMDMLTTGYLPVDFPQYQKGIGIKAYNELVMQYLRAHPDIVIPKVREKLKV